MGVSPRKAQKPPVTPGEYLVEEFLKPMGLTQSDFAKEIGISKAYLSDIVNGRRGVSAEMAMRFEAALDMPALFWLHGQAEVDLYAARHDAKAIASVKSIQRFHTSRTLKGNI